MKRKKLNIGFDVDDTLIAFTQAICDNCEKKFGHKFPYEEVVWGFSNYRQEETDYVHQLFRDVDFIKSIPMFTHTMEMLKEVHERGHDIFFPTSTYSNAMTTRALYLCEKIDFIHPRNYIMTGRKDVIRLDMLFDDCLANIQTSIAKIPVLVNTPWNKDATGFIRANSPEKSADEYLHIIDLAEEGLTRQEIYELQNPVVSSNSPSIIIIVGGSGVGKTVVTQKILETSDAFEKVVTNTSRSPRPGEINGKDYNFCTEDEFKSMIACNDLLEYANYAGNYYGTSKNAIEMILKKGKNAIIVMEVEGAKAIKKMYPNNSYTIFLTRNKEDLIRSIMERDVSIDEKVGRIARLEDDFITQEQCDYRIVNDTIDGTSKKIINMFTGKE